MKIQNKIYLSIFCFIVIGTLCAVFLPKEPKRNEEAVLKAGAGDDISGLLMKEVLKMMESQSKISSEEIENSAFLDCCSNSAQWAMNAKEINVAFYCSHIAKHTVENNEDVMIYAPVIMNSELIVYQSEWKEIRELGVLQGRKQEQKLAEETYPQIEQIHEISQKGIAYSLEDGQIDGAILDITKAAYFPSYFKKPLTEQDYISYVLVVDKEFEKTEVFQEFVEAYNQAVEKLQDTKYLAKCMEVDEMWVKDTTIKFLTLPESE